MSDVEITKASSRGQIVLPKGIRDELGIKAGDYLAIFSDGETIHLKKIERIELKKKFEKRFNELSVFATEKGITKKDVEDAVKDVRKKKKSVS